MDCPGRIKIPYRWSAGRAGSAFLAALRDRAQFVGLRCPTCRKVSVPPRPHCPECRVAGTEWLDVGPRGTLVSWTVVREPAATDVLPVPYAFATILLRGADTALLHLIGETPFELLRAGLELEPVFADARRGHMLDVKWFRTPRS